MKIGPTQTITEKCFPDMEIDITDRNGTKLKIRDKVKIRGCVANYGYIGYSEGRVVVYFEAHGTSVQWHITDKIQQKIELCEISE